MERINKLSRLICSWAHECFVAIHAEKMRSNIRPVITLDDCIWDAWGALFMQEEEAQYIM